MPVCNDNVISMSKEVNRKGYHYSYMENPEACTGCTNCVIVCPIEQYQFIELKFQHNLK